MDGAVTGQPGQWPVLLGQRLADPLHQLTGQLVVRRSTEPVQCDPLGVLGHDPRPAADDAHQRGRELFPAWQRQPVQGRGVAGSIEDLVAGQQPVHGVREDHLQLRKHRQPVDAQRAQPLRRGPHLRRVAVGDLVRHRLPQRRPSRSHLRVLCPGQQRRTVVRVIRIRADRQLAEQEPDLRLVHSPTPQNAVGRTYCSRRRTSRAGRA